MYASRRYISIRKVHMFKVLWLLKRKTGITLEQSRNLGTEVLGPSSRRIQTKLQDRNGRRRRPYGSSWKCIGYSRMGIRLCRRMGHAQSFEEIMRIFADPVMGKIFHDDEEHFPDRESVFLVKCDTRDTGTGDGAETLKLRRKKSNQPSPRMG
jgi:hypothetical protein